MSAGYEVLSLDAVGPYASENHGDSLLIPLRSRLDVRAFGVNAWTAETGKKIVPPHEEDSGNEELYVVVRGRATFTVGDETLNATAGTLVHVVADTFRTAVAEEPGTIVLAVGATPGEPFQTHGWDDVVIAFAEARDGRVDEGRRLLERLRDRYPEAPPVLYNLACFESRAGNTDAAFERLREAMALAPDEVRRYAEHDTDLDPLRGDPRWQETMR